MESKVFMKTVGIKGALFLATCSLSPFAFSGGFSSCSENFYKGAAPVFTKDSLAKNTYQFCYKGFANQYSGVSKTGLWSAHHLTPSRIKQGKSIKRENNFFEETKVPKQYRALLSSYRGSGYDRGHLSPSADMGTRAQQNDSFSLSNMIPQAPDNNQKTWNHLEQAVRTTVTKTKHSAYVITGGMFLGEKIRKVGDILVPSHVYKVVYFPDLKVMGAYVAVNDNSGRIDSTSVAQLEQYAGIKFFPQAGTGIQNKRFNLPLSANQAYKMTSISAMSSNQSDIFTQMPDSSRSFQPVNSISDGLFSGKAVEGKIVEYGIKILEKVVK